MNSVYVRSKKGVNNIIYFRILFLVPLILYGFYKNGLYLYINGYVGIPGLLKPLLITIISMIIAILIDLLFSFIKKEKFNISFNLEYALIIAMLMPIKINYILYFIVLLIGLIISKFVDDKVNLIALMFIIIYLLTKNFDYLNSFEISKKLNLSFIDYFLGKYNGGICTSHILLIIISLIGLTITNSNKSSISFSMIITLIIGFILLSIIKNYDFIKILCSNSYLFICTFVATSYPSSAYTNKGKILYGISCGLLTIILYLFNPILAPFVAVLIVSLLHKIFDFKYE